MKSHKKLEEAFASGHSRLVITGCRQSGITTAMAREAAASAIRGEKVYYRSHTIAAGSHFIDIVRNELKKMDEAACASISGFQSSKLSIVFKNGGAVHVFSNPRDLNPDLLILDNAAFIPQEIIRDLEPLFVHAKRVTVGTCWSGKSNDDRIYVMIANPAWKHVKIVRSDLNKDAAWIDEMKNTLSPEQFELEYPEA